MKRSTRTAEDTRLTPYDTGERCEPKLWQPDRESVLAAMEDGECGDIGNVDFDDENGDTVCLVHVSRNLDGKYGIRIVPMVDEKDFVIEIHYDDEIVLIEPADQIS